MAKSDVVLALHADLKTVWFVLQEQIIEHFLESLL